MKHEFLKMVLKSMSQDRRDYAAQSPEAFTHIYLQRICDLPLSRLHRELYELAQIATKERSKLIAVAAPRGHAKSTVISLAYVLWSALYQTESLIVLVSATRDQAVLLLKTVKDELQSNSLLLQDFPEACNPPGTKPVPKPWRDNQIVLRNQVCVKALGANQGLRGLKHGRHRPTLIIVDDLENQEHVESEQRQKLINWFEKTLLKAGEPRTNVIVVGTIIHYDSFLSYLIGLNPNHKAPGWEGRRFQAIEIFSDRQDLWKLWEKLFCKQEMFEQQTGPDAARKYFQANEAAMLEGTRVLWPQRESYYQLMEMKVSGGWASFQSEKQNDPVDGAMSIFKREQFRYWDDEYAGVQELIAKLGSNAVFYGACDPSLGQCPMQGDYTAIVLLVKDDRDGTAYVIEADIARRSTNDTLTKILQYAQMYSFHEFAVEANQFQDLLADDLERRLRRCGLSTSIRRLTNTSNKKNRIESLEPSVSQGRLRFSRRHTLLLEQMWRFPLADHDDGPDALEMAVGVALRRRYTSKMVKITGA